MRTAIPIPNRAPFNHDVLLSLLGGYRAAKDKISRMEKEGDIIRLKRGLYVSGKPDSTSAISPELIANHLYSPSYVSCESALSYYGIIPEHVFLMRSVALPRSRRFSTPLGDFEYLQSDPKVYPVGVQSVVSGSTAFMMATPEKALCDQIIFTRGLRIQSVTAMEAYIEEDLRCDLSMLQKFNPNIIRECLAAGARKQNELNLLIKFLSL
jgi:predicted transcriptional regulator of viral defense system